MLSKLKKFGGKNKIAMLILSMLITLILVMTSISPMDKADAATITYSGYKIYVRSSSGSDITATSYTYGEENDYTKGESLGANYSFYDTSGIKNINFGRAVITTLNESVYEGDKILIKFTSGGVLPNKGYYLVTTNVGQYTLSARMGETEFTIPGTATGRVSITARDTSTEHIPNGILEKNFLYILNFNIGTRSTTIDGSKVLDTYVTEQLNNNTYTGRAISAYNTNLAQYVDYVGGTPSATNAGSYSIVLKPKKEYKWGDGTYGVRAFNWTIKKAAHPAFNFTNGNTINFGTNLPITLSGAQGAVTYSVISGTGAGTISGTTFIPTKAGTVTIRATVAESTNHLGTIKDLTVTINKAAHPAFNFTNSSTISFGSNLPIILSGVQGAVTYSVINGTGAGTISGTTFIPTKAGTVTIRATVAESTNHLGTTKDLTVTINKATHPAFNFTNSSTVSFGSNLSITLSGVQGAVTYSVINGTGEGTISGTTFTPTKVGTVTIRATVAASTNYLGTTKDLTVTISAFNLTQNNVTFGTINNPTFNNAEQKTTPTITATVGGKNVTLINKSDFDYSYKDNIVQGTATVTITGKGNYKGSASKTFTINKLTVSNANIVFGTIDDQVYTGGLIKPIPSISVIINGINVLLSADDYDILYEYNTLVNGTSANIPTIKVTFKGNYSGTATKEFNIIPSDQNFTFTSVFDSLECFKENTMTFFGTLTSTGARSWTSSNPDIILIDQNGKLTAKNKVGSVTITLNIAADNNFKARTITKVITTSLLNGFYIGNIYNTETHTVYATLKEAVDAANNGENIMVRGNNTVSEVVDVDAAKRIKIIGENGAKITASGSIGGILNVSGQLEIHNLTLDGNNINGNSIINVSGGNLKVINTQFINGKANEGGAIYVGTNSKLTVLDIDTQNYSQETSFVGNSANLGGAIFLEYTKKIKPLKIHTCVVPI